MVRFSDEHITRYIFHKQLHRRGYPRYQLWIELGPTVTKMELSKITYNYIHLVLFDQLEGNKWS